uniref:Proteasome subunit beta n=1 Tax=Strombidium inclinatum TaxID=197538 RepID=A0A7S3IKA9_9SPIT|mmetsp:Transcript_24489/g.37974  ORF Transcript_24489/g.37974 Transcript_24489/m.37974 type:complete len:315 (+) Transcript_24489:28-972(+)
MDINDFGYGGDIPACDFMDDDNFGFADCFSKTPLHAIVPNASEKVSPESAVDRTDNMEIKSDGFCFKLHPSEDQAMLQRQLKDMAPKMMDVNKGTTTLAFQFQGGVLVAVDARATQGPFISSGAVRKVIEVNEFILGTMAGGAADCFFWEKYVAMQCRLYQLRHGVRPSVAQASMMLCSIMKQYKGYGLSMGTMFTGSDSTGASLYYIDNDATRLRGNLFAVGSGGTFAYGVLDSEYRYDLTIDEAVKLGIKAIVSATFKDSASGGVVRVYHVTNEGNWRIVHDQIDVSELHYQFEAAKKHRGDGRENQPAKFV